MTNLICLMDHILFKTFSIILNILFKILADNSPAQIYVNKIKNRIAFKIKTDCKLELSKESVKLLGSTKTDGDQDKNDENVPKLESSEVVLVHCNLVNNNYQQSSKVLFTFVPDKQFGQVIP